MSHIGNEVHGGFLHYRMGFSFFLNDYYLDIMNSNYVSNDIIIFRCAAWIPFGDIIATMVKVPSVEWHQVFTSPWADSAERERKYVYLFSLLKDLKLDFNSACLLTIVALFDTDRINDNQYMLSNDSIKKIRYDIYF